MFWIWPGTCGLKCYPSQFVVQVAFVMFFCLDVRAGYKIPIIGLPHMVPLLHVLP